MFHKSLLTWWFLKTGVKFACFKRRKQMTNFRFDRQTKTLKSSWDRHWCDHCGRGGRTRKFTLKCTSKTILWSENASKINFDEVKMYLKYYFRRISSQEWSKKLQMMMRRSRSTPRTPPLMTTPSLTTTLIENLGEHCGKSNGISRSWDSGQNLRLSVRTRSFGLTSWVIIWTLKDL